MDLPMPVESVAAAVPAKNFLRSNCPLLNDGLKVYYLANAKIAAFNASIPASARHPSSS
jgi:hypothetical protein